MKIFAIVGNSDSGKTLLVSRLVPEFKRRGCSVAVAKHCAHGFSLNDEGKDSGRFLQAGSDAVLLVGPDRTAYYQNSPSEQDFSALAVKYFDGLDFVLVEGGRSDRSLQKIEVLHPRVAEKVRCPPEELLAVVSDVEVSVDRPLFGHDQIGEIVDFLESCPSGR